jgi:ribonuclease HII
MSKATWTSLPRTIEAKKQGFCVIGVDEAGRGPLCGPVVAGACVYMSTTIEENVDGVRDSKQISEPERKRLYQEIVTNKNFFFGVKQVENKRIDEINILQATFEAMTGAVEHCLAKLPSGIKNIHILVDGPKVPPQLASRFPCTPVVRGDGREFIIAAASIIAKVTRDTLMMEMHNTFPMYNLAQHKGYPTAEHMHLVRVHGPCVFHRLTFAPLKHMVTKRLESAASKTRKLPATEKPCLLETVDGLRRSARLRCRQ